MKEMEPPLPGDSTWRESDARAVARVMELRRIFGLVASSRLVTAKGGESVVHYDASPESASAPPPGLVCSARLP